MSRSRGLYEVLITETIATELRALDQRLQADTTPLRAAEAADRIALHVGRIVQRAIASLEDEQRVTVGVALARTIFGVIDRAITKANVTPDSPIAPGAILRAVLARLPDGRPESIEEPLIPLLDTSSESIRIATCFLSCLLGECGARRPAGVHARQDRGAILSNDPISRLRHQSRSHSLGESIGHAVGKPNGAALPAPPVHGFLRLAVCPPPHRRSGILVSRSGDLCSPRIRNADGDYLAARGSSSG